MATDKKNDFTLTHYLNLTAQRDTSLGQVPFFLGLKNNPPVIRRILEAILAAVTWEVTDVADSASATVGVDDVVILSGHSATITLPSLAAGRMLVVKDKSGTAGTSGQAITVNTAGGGDVIDGLNTSFSLGANFGAVMFIGGNGSEWHSIALV